MAGGHGQIARYTSRLLSGAGHEVRSLIRNPDQSDDIRADGGTPVVVDLEAVTDVELADRIGPADAVVFAAGAGPGSGAARKETVDYEGAVKLLGAAERLGVAHYVMISAIGADADHPGDEVFDVYLRAKGRADDAVRAGPVPHTIIRPTRLTDDEPTGKVELSLGASGGPVTRADVAAVVAATVERSRPTGATLDLTGGDTPVAEAVEVV
ncbi:MAG: NAD(P)H-binding protein [Actinomycetota bacterium]